MDHHVHVRTKGTSKNGSGGGSSSSSSNGNPSKMGCEKAARRLRTILLKASRIGLTNSDVAGLTNAEKLLLPRRDDGWKLTVFFILIFGAGLVVAFICTARKGCSRIEDINLAT